MAVRDRLRKGATPYLEAGEEIQAVFLVACAGAQNATEAVAATDRRLLLFRVDGFARPRSLVEETERATRLGPWSGLVFHRLPAFGGNLIALFCSPPRVTERGETGNGG